jgi:hypothetical protein
MANYAKTRVRLEEVNHKVYLWDSNQKGTVFDIRCPTDVWYCAFQTLRMQMEYLIIPLPGWEPRRAVRSVDNRHLNSIAESNIVNVRDCPCRRRPAVGRGHLGRVGTLIVVGGRESRPQGEGG